MLEMEGTGVKIELADLLYSVRNSRFDSHNNSVHCKSEQKVQRTVLSSR